MPDTKELALTDLVPSRETCARLAEAGYEQETRFMWWKNEVGRWRIVDYHPSQGERHPAPTAAELGQRFKQRANFEGAEVLWYYIVHDWLKHRDVWLYEVASLPLSEPIKIYAETEAEARALLWLKLKEEDLL